RPFQQSAHPKNRQDRDDEAKHHDDRCERSSAFLRMGNRKIEIGIEPSELTQPKSPCGRVLERESENQRDELHPRAPSICRNRGQSKAGPGSVLRPGEISLWPTTSAVASDG